MSSTFLTRMRLGPSLVDAKGVSQLYAGRVRGRDIVLLMAAAFTVMIVVAIISEPTRVFFDAFWLTLRDLWLSITGACGWDGVGASGSSASPASRIPGVEFAGRAAVVVPSFSSSPCWARF